MLEMLPDLPDHVVGIRAIGDVEGDDYEDVLVPAIRDRLGRHEKIRLLYVLGSEFAGYEAHAAWEDAKLGVRTFTSYERVAVVTDSALIRRSVRAFAWLMPGEVRVFPVDDLEGARAWIVAWAGTSRAGASDRVRPAGSEPVPCRVVKGPIGLAHDEPEG